MIATQRGEARRIDRQLYGRGGRQGDPGSFEAILSLEDDPLRNFLENWILLLLLPFVRTPLSGLAELLMSLAQRAEERRHARMRRKLMLNEEQVGDLLSFSGTAD